MNIDLAIPYIHEQLSKCPITVDKVDRRQVFTGFAFSSACDVNVIF